MRNTASASPVVFKKFHSFRNAPKALEKSSPLMVRQVHLQTLVSFVWLGNEMPQAYHIRIAKIMIL